MSKLATLRLVTIAASFFAVLSSSAHDSRLVKISEDSFSDPLAQHATEVEPVMVVKNDTIVTAFQVGRFIGVGADTIGWSTSKDSGKTWHRGFLTGTSTAAGGLWAAVSEPVLAYDAKHETFLVSFIPFDDQGNGRGLLVSQSKDGLNWSAPTISLSSAAVDTHWLSCDNSSKSRFYGNCYDAILDFSSPVAYVTKLTTSKDGGLTWSTPIESPDQLAGVVSSMAILPNGIVVVMGRNEGINGDQTYSVRSVDGGISLEATNSITTQSFMYPWMRADPNPASTVDKRGTIYVVFADCRFRANCLPDPACRFRAVTSFCATNDLLLSKSNDGVHWSAPKRIPIDPVSSNIDHVIPGLGSLSESEEEGGTKLALTYYYTTNANLPDGTTCTYLNCQINAGYIGSEDGGKTWHRAAKIAGPMTETWLAATYAGEMVADYISAVFVDGHPFGAFAIARAPNVTTGEFDEAIYAGPLPESDD
jgi:hypothetical protein